MRCKGITNSWEMKIILFSRPSAKSSADNFGALLDSIEAHDFEWCINDTAAQWLAAQGMAERVDKQQYSDINTVIDNDSVVISYGGDGTMLSAVRAIGGASVPVLGINSGRLGFLAPVSKDDFNLALDALMTGDYRIEKRSLLRIEGEFDKQSHFPLAFNEFSIQRSHMGMIGIKVEIDGRLAANYWSDGVIVATPTGSTAYSLSAGGPIVAPECNCLILTPIAPHNFTMRPIVIPDSSTIRLTIDARDPHALAGIDNDSFSINNGASFTLTRAEQQVFLIKLQNISFYNTLKDKMMWGLDSRESK